VFSEEQHILRQWDFSTNKDRYLTYTDLLEI